ncbi:family 2 encapsulin nanocompartment cargo protein polyprenyl transferase [Spongiactinospora sp. TRM90649]|uniref:family 2 encapsulin nanocompartment cargo protein polyprenyl transferase n=1 Tax=Spongiactinospora sp. TRM90649 TaxID=3031114 RepID=UPI0023F6DB07|nr:family 2 encapsulin nanocompartment cargo protein polyprenyl transferase [Spongiactinospora sp. TRM90649]MDF5758542.1 family 2 encapsulin nanocompartment cargo protein polyprenyl transferase [Spongiactinospora sp. TRM90649]
MSTVQEMTQPRPATEVLAWGRGVTEPAMREAVDTLPDTVRRIVGYHFGWLDERGEPVHANAGKAIRPVIALLAAEAVGGTLAEAVPAAVAVELTHNFSLLHDDVMDGDATRRHRPTAWAVFGRGPAILAGDALMTLAFDVLAAAGRPAARRAARILGSAVLELIDGQYADVAFEARHDVGLAECRRMSEAKTGALLGGACAIGALYGGGTDEDVERLTAFGRRIGLAFQHVDDLLGIWGDPATTGKPVHSDLRNRKKSLPVVFALNSGTPAGHELAALYAADGPLTGPDLARAAELVELADGRAWSQAEADALLAGALRELAGTRPGVPSRAVAELEGLARLVTRRDH